MRAHDASGKAFKSPQFRFSANAAKPAALAGNTRRTSSELRAEMPRLPGHLAKRAELRARRGRTTSSTAIAARTPKKNKSREAASWARTKCVISVPKQKLATSD